MIYGAGGMGKTTRTKEVAEYIWKTRGLKTRVVNADGGGTESAYLRLIDEGAAEIWHIDQWAEQATYSTMALACKGWWPSDVSTPNSPLLPPTAEWKPCPTCGKDSGAKGLLAVPKCISCGVAYPNGTILKTQRDRINGMENVGLVVFEGFTRFGEMLLDSVKRTDPAGGNTITEGSGADAFKITSPGQAHYLMAQSHLGQFVASCRRIPVPLVIWTALEIRADDDGKPLYGPKGPGKALTSVCIPWFTDVLHLDGYPKKEKGIIVKDENGVEILDRRLFLSAHFPPDNPGFRFAAKTSVPGMPLSIEPKMSTFFAEMEKAYEKGS